MRSHPKAASVPSTDRENRRFSLGVIAAMLVCTAAFLGIGAPAASAAAEAQPTYALSTQFPSGAAGALFTPEGPLALDSKDHIFLADEFGEVVHVYSSETLDGASVAEVAPGQIYPTELAIDLTTDDLFVQEAGIGSGVIKRFTSDGSNPPTYTLDAGFSVPAGGQIAVNQSTHELLVADAAAEGIRRYDTSGTLLGTIATPGITPSLLAIAADGSMFVSSGPDVVHLSSTGSVLGEIADAGEVRALAVEPTSQNLVVNVNGTLAVYSPAGTLLSTKQAAAYAGLAIDGTSGRLYASNLNFGGGGEISVFIPAVAPGVEMPSVSAVTTFGFHVETEVDPGEEGGGVPAESAVRFEYRQVGEENWTTTPSQEVNAPGSYEADISGLLPNLEYEVRAVASNSLASKTTDAVKVATPADAPLVDTASATDVSETSAVLNGNINPMGLGTTYHFEYGETMAYGSRVPVSIEATAGNGRLAKSFSRTVTGLSPGTTYHFRLVASNSLGTTEGSDRTFSTITLGGMQHRAYEQVTPAGKHGVLVVPGLGMLAEENGNGISYTTKEGANSSAAFTRMVSTRGGDDWNDWINTDPPVTVSAGALLTAPTLAISPDFTHAFVVSNRALTPGGIDRGANLLLHDLATGEYALIATSSAPGAFNSFVGIGRAGRFHAGAPDFSWLVFNSEAPLVPGAPPNALYRWSESAGLKLVSILPDGDPTSALYGSNAVYKPVSADGSRIYFTAVGGSEEGVFLQEGSGPAIPISLSQIPGDPATPQPATLMGVNKDGRYAFLVSPVRLTSDAPGNPTDLYRYDASDGTLEYLGVSIQTNDSTGSLGIADDGNTIYFDELDDGGNKLAVWHDGAVRTVVNQNVNVGTARPSPNGRYFVVFEEGQNQVEGGVKLYDAETDELNCIACLPDGTPVSAISPGENVSNQYADAVLNNGEVFFSTKARLVAADVNGTNDVYAYRDGSVHLISPGNAPSDAIIAHVSADGRDVFFTTAQKLVGRDNDESIDIYDARVDGGLPSQSPPPPQECLRDDCKATPNAGPELPFGGSEALSGPENVNPPKHKKCGKGKRAKKVKGKVRCVKKHKANKNKKGGNR